MYLSEHHIAVRATKQIHIKHYIEWRSRKQSETDSTIPTTTLKHMYLK